MRRIRLGFLKKISTRCIALILFGVVILSPYIPVRASVTIQPAGEKGAPIPFDVHGGYFVSNQFEPEKAESFVVIRDQKAFDQIFGTAMVMHDKAHRLPPNVFDTKIVVAAIKRGKAVWTFSVKDVTTDGGTLTIRYTTTAEKSDSAEFACPLIVSVPKGDYKAIVFDEDGKVVKTIESK